MRKKLAAVLLTAALGMSVLAGCGSAESDNGTGAENQTAEENQSAEEKDAAEEVQQEEAQQPENEGEAEEFTLTIAAAASLKNAYEEDLIPMFEEHYYDYVTVSGVYDSSGKLQTQIEEGLEADIFMSAAAKQMNALSEEGFIADDTKVDLLVNKIVLIVPAGETVLTSFEDIVHAESIALGDPESVPAGQYAKEALTSLGIWDDIQDKVSFGTNVTEVLNQVAAGSAAAGIVYATDAASMPDAVTVVAEAPAGSLAEEVIYPVAVVANTAYKEHAESFLAFLQSEEALAIFEKYGFTVME